MKMPKVETNQLSNESTNNGAVVEVLDVAAAHLLFNYLSHHCYGETAIAFLSQWLGTSMDVLKSNLSSLEVKSLQTLEYRHYVRTMLQDGKISEGLKYLEEFFPQIFQSDTMTDTDDGDDGDAGWLKFKLLCQQFIELVRKGDLMTALEFTDSTLSALAQNRPKRLAYLQDILVLLAYTDPSESPVKHLLSLSHRTELADQVNSAILKQFESTLETVLKQLFLVYAQTSSLKTDIESPDLTVFLKDLLKQ